ncbi:MAG TPA: hypothetical protein VJZ71_18960 [Phycisphaerae bacterium]|nr:hypothetical protein [Phycisphaerae bacterium]
MSPITRRSLLVAALVTAYLSGQPRAYGQGEPPTTTARVNEAASQPASALSGDERLLHWRQVFFWAAVLLLIFFIAAWVIIRFSLRYRAYLFREKPPPTPSEDVWRMHRVPEHDVQEGEPREE